MKKNSTEVPQASIKLRNYLFPVVILIVLMGLAIGVFSKSVQQLPKMSNPFFNTATPTPMTIPTHTDTQYPTLPVVNGPIGIGIYVYPAPLTTPITIVHIPPQPDLSDCFILGKPGYNSILVCNGGGSTDTNTPAASSTYTLTNTLTPTPTSTNTPTPTATFTPTSTPTPTRTSTPKPSASPVMVAGGSMLVFIVCFVLLIVIIIRFASRWSNRNNAK